jgi:hypothetical protein
MSARIAADIAISNAYLTDACIESSLGNRGGGQ